MPAVVELGIILKENTSVQIVITLKESRIVIFSYMVVRIDIANLPSHLRRALMKEIGLSDRSRKSPDNNESKLSDTDKCYSNASEISDVSTIDDENNPHITTRKIKDVLIKNGISKLCGNKAS